MEQTTIKKYQTLDNAEICSKEIQCDLSHPTSQSSDGTFTFSKENNSGEYYKISIDDQWVLNRVKRLLGQLEHNRRETVRSDKDRSNQHTVDRIDRRLVILHKDLPNCSPREVKHVQNELYIIQSLLGGGALEKHSKTDYLEMHED